MTLTLEVEEKRHLQFKHPFSLVAAGPSGSGKTYLVRDILEHHKSTICDINKDIIKVIWCHGIWQEIYSKAIKNVDFKYLEDLPTEEEVIGYDIIVIDDLMSEISNNEYVLSLFTKGSHHNNQSVIFLTQNLYHKGGIIRNLNRNTQYLLLFKSPRDKMQIYALARQTYPNESKFFISAYEQATSQPHGYLLADYKQDTPENLRLKTRIIPCKESDYKLSPFGFVKK